MEEVPETQEEKELTKSKRKRSAPAAAATPSPSGESRTPLKRQRVPVQKFQSPAEEIIPIPSTSKAKTKEDTELIHKKGAFLAVRGDEGTFYLCRTAQNFFSNTRKFKIQWLDLSEPPDVYKLDFLDSTDADCVLTNITMKRITRETFKLPEKEQKRVEEILAKSLRKERGEPIDEVVTVEDEDSDEDWEDDEPSPPKKAKKEKAKPQPKPRKSVSPKGKSSKEKKSKGDKKSAKAKEKDKKKKKDAKKKEKKKGPDRKLKPNPKIKVLEKDPFFETKDKVEFISKNVHGKLAIRAVLNNDMKLLQSLMENKEEVFTLDRFRSVDVEKNALHYALEQNNHEAIKLLVNDYFMKDNPRLKDNVRQHILLQTQDTGRYNRMSLGIGNIRAISQSRGSKEGNDAFAKDFQEEDRELEDYVEDSLKLGVTSETLEILMTCLPDSSRDELLQRAISNLYQAVLCGNRKLAGYLVEEGEKLGETGFGFLHKEVLLFEKEELRPTIMASSVKKKPWTNKSITPLHCSAINPNVNYLKRLLSVEPNINLEDREHRRPIHFAAVSEGVACLEFLLQRGASPTEVDTQGMTPLHYACSAGRPRNVDILLKKSKEASSKQGDISQAKWGPGGVDRPSRSTYCPIHIAIHYGHVDVVKILIKHQVDVNKQLSAGKNRVTPLMLAASHGHLDIARILVQSGAIIEQPGKSVLILIKHQVDVNKQLSAGKNRVTPLMLAASHGHLDIARILVQSGAIIEQPDKLKRTALTHAIMNGNTTVASYLLYLGADPNKADSSGNTLVHYAAGYGWHPCLKLLLDAGADPKRPNTWKTTPVGIAFLKGHIGMVDFLLSQPAVDINFKNDEGKTLASVAVCSALEPGLYGQMLYLIDEQKADPRITDANGLDTLHHLASNSIRKSEWGKQNEIDDEKMELTVKIAKLLLEAGCDPTCKTKEGRTALMMAVEQVNIKLVKLLVEMGGSVTSHKSDEGKTILHMMAEQCMSYDLSEILRILVEQKHEPQPNKKPQKRAVSEEKTKQQVNSLDHTIKENNIEEAGGGDTKMEVEEGNGTTNTKADDAKMEVDDKGTKKEPAENGAVNGMDTDTPPPELERFVDPGSVEESQQDVWPVMAAEVDNEGFTPLLRACYVYRNFKKPSKTANEVIKKCGENGRNFIQAVIELANADVSATVQEKELTNDNETPLTEKDKYVKDGKCSALHLLVHVGHETLEETSSSALETVLRHHPNLEHRNLDGKTALVLAVETKEDKALTLLAKAGAHVNLTYHHSFSMGDMTPILVAAKDGHASIVKALIEAKADVHVVNTKTKESPLHFAVQYRDDEPNVVNIVRMLLESGADICQGTTSPLHTAVLANLGTSNASTDLEEFLLSKGANVFAKDEKGRLPLHYAFITKAHPESTTPLDPIELCSVLTDSMRNKELDIQDENGQTPLHLAAVRGATICCVHLLQRGVALTTRDKDGNTAFSLAVKNKHDSCALMLLQRGASVDDSIVISKKIPDWKTYHNKKLVWTWKPERLEPQHQVKKYGIYQGAIFGELQGVAHMVLDTSGLTGKAIEAALREDKYHIALRHLKRIRDARVINGYTNDEGQNLLHLLALHTTPGKETALQLKVVEVLLERGVSLSQLDKYQRTPLMYAAFRHQPIQLGKEFLEKDPKCDLSKLDIYGRSVMVAYFWDHEKIYEQSKDNTEWIRLLVEAGSSLDIVYQIPVSTTPMFDITISEYVPDFFKTLENCGSMTPLISAIHHSDFGLTKFLLQNGASSNLADSNGVTPLMHAVRENDKALVKLLLNNSYVEETTGKADSRQGLKRQMSRQVFAIKPASHTPEPVPEKHDDDDEGKDEGDDEGDDEEEDEEDENEEEDNEEEVSENSPKMQKEWKTMQTQIRLQSDLDEGNEEDDTADDDEDADTDVVDDDEEEEQEAQHLPIPRLGSKQPSMKRMATSVGSMKDEYPVVEKTSDVNVNAADSQGWTVIHHLVSPLEYGTFDNEELLYVLYKTGASLNEKDAAGLTPLNRALICGAVKLSQMLQRLQNIEADKQEKPTFLPFRNSAAEEDLSLSSGDMFEADADSMLRKFELSAAGQPTPEIARPKPDKHCMVANIGEVMYDHEQNLPYDVILSKIEVRSLLYDMYNFYKMQIIWHKAKDMYILFTRWGRIGHSGQYQHTPYHKLSEAVTEFCKIFRAKTGNYWSNVKNFQEQPKKYRLIELEQSQKPVVKVNFDLQSSSFPSKLPVEVQDLLKEMADVGMMEAAMNKANIAERFMPFGRIKRDSLVEARKLLQQIGEIVVNIEKNRRNATGFDSGEHQKNCEKIAELSTQFFNLVPLEGYEYDRIHPLNDKSGIKAQMRLISILLDLEVASKILLGAQYRSAEMNPLDYIYQSIGCSIQPLREDDVESQYILKYIKSSTKHCRTPKVLNIFKLWREGEEEKQKRLNLGNHKLLWHGSGVANFMSILHRGLLVAPPEAPMTGHAFGEGVYTSDTFSKSVMYCYNGNPKSEIKLALLCEVALGNVKEDIDANIEVDLLHSEFNSLHIQGQIVPDHGWDVAVPYGASMPLGCAAETQWKNPDGNKPWVRFNEYIVQDSEQICLRYLVQFV